MDSASHQHHVARRERAFGLLAALLWLSVFAGARFALDADLGLSPAARVAIAVAPVLPYGLFLWAIVAHVRSLDELHRRVHLEALAIAFLLAMLLLMTLGLVDVAVGLSPDDFSLRHVWAFLPVLYFGALAFVWRRYR